MLTLRSIFVLDFYPRPPRGGRQVCDKINQNPERFLSTPSARRATSHNLPARVSWTISIHALREEGDSTSRRRKPERRHFYPRPPRGGRRKCIGEKCMAYEFLSTPSARRATRPSSGSSCGQRFLSTPSARRATTGAEPRSPGQSYFYPRPPRGGRPESGEPQQ